MRGAVMTPERSRSGTVGYAMRVYLRKFAGRRGNGSTDVRGLVALAGSDGRTKNLTGSTGQAGRFPRRNRRRKGRLQPGDIAIIDHADLDRVSAESLLNCQVAAVVNAAPSMSGRYPNLGPQLLLDAGVPLIYDVGSHVFDNICDRSMDPLSGDTLHVRH